MVYLLNQPLYNKRILKDSDIGINLNNRNQTAIFDDTPNISFE